MPEIVYPAVHTPRRRGAVGWFAAWFYTLLTGSFCATVATDWVYDAVYVLVDGNTLRPWAHGLELLISPIVLWPVVLVFMAVPVMIYVTIVRSLSVRVPPTLAWRVLVCMLLAGILNMAIAFRPLPNHTDPRLQTAHPLQTSFFPYPEIVVAMGITAVVGRRRWLVLM